MASAPTNINTLVTIKVNIEGSNRRFKLPLRDLGADTLTHKLRLLLSIPPTADAIFERYSDSLADFVTLDSSNASVYKQLYRAAKAKLKLRLKVTVINVGEKEEPVTSKKATVEDELPSAVEKTATLGALDFPTPYYYQAMEAKQTPPSEPTTVASYPSYAEYLHDLTFNFKPAVEVPATEAPAPEALAPEAPAPEAPVPEAPAAEAPAASTSVPIAAVATSRAIPVTIGAAARDRWHSELPNLVEERRASFRKLRQYPAAPLPSTYSVYCNCCNTSIPDEHYHCDTCDNGDYDLCQACVNNGILCSGENHWMIKRSIKNGEVIHSVTETLPPRASPTNESKTTLVPVEEPKEEIAVGSTRTCNSCIQEYPEDRFVTCTDCEDFDLCVPCHEKHQHGHNPKHRFAPAVEGTALEPLSQALLEAGRNVAHQAICDGCDKYIYGVRHKCLDCPDWDYCGTCIPSAQYIHPRHRFVPIYESIADSSRSVTANTFHYFIHCDGPLCVSKATNIQGVRYKCAVCHDTDFCASCEAHPSNLHNRSHPLIKFKTAIRNVSVTTMGDHDDGRPMPVMGDRRSHRSHTNSKSTETKCASSANAATQVQTVADLQPTEAEAVKVEKEEKVEEEKHIEAQIVEAPKELESEKEVDEPLIAYFVRDAVPDGTILAPGAVFEQTWVLRNGGRKAWPAGCTVKFVGGDNMCAVDPEHPASVHELVSAAESTTCYSEVAPGQEHGFTVLMRTPNKSGKVISYWRLTGPEGYKFGHRLWCDITVEGPAPVVKDEVIEETEEATKEGGDLEKSQMIFPTLEKESPVASLHEAFAPPPVEAPASTSEDEFVDFTSETHVEDEVTEDGFLTDEEYDILDASDEEYLVEQGKVVKK